VQDLVADCDIDVVGLAYDFCVRATALGARSAGARVRVLRELTAAVHPEGIPTLEEELTAAGVEIVRTVGRPGPGVGSSAR
jgi:nicotinamidase/pyrazinamidase